MYAGLDVPCDAVLDWPNWMCRIGAMRIASRMRAAPPKSQGRRTIIRAHAVQPREAVPSLRMCGMSTRGPTAASRAGSRVSTTATLHSGISMPPKPMLRSSGTGMTTRAMRLMATVTPDANTACPAVRIEMRTASSLSCPCAISSRQRDTTSKE